MSWEEKAKMFHSLLKVVGVFEIINVMLDCTDLAIS